MNYSEEDINRLMDDAVAIELRELAVYYDDLAKRVSTNNRGALKQISEHLIARAQEVEPERCSKALGNSRCDLKSKHTGHHKLGTVYFYGESE